jgi:hypothetical protein
MNKPTTIFLLALATCVFPLHSKSQITGSGNQPLSVTGNVEADVSHSTQKKGTFFITPFYEFTRFKKLELVSQTNNNRVWGTETTDVFTNEQINAYNDNFGTEYHNSMSAVKFGYHALDGLGISGYVGVNHFDFENWISDENTQTINSKYPALTMGLSVDYAKPIGKKIAGMAMLSYNYCTTENVNIDNNSGQDITSSSLKSMYWETNLVLAYPCKKLLPYAGVGFTQQFVNSLHEEKVLATNDNGEDVVNYTEFDARYRGSSFYGFAGVGYTISETVSMYIRSSFPNPLRANIGIKIVL